MVKAERRGGRKPGTPNKRTAEFQTRIRASGTTPLDYMLNVLRSEESNSLDKAWAAQHAAPYCHPRLASIERAIQIELPPTDTAENVGKALSVIAQCVASGALTTGEGRNLASLLETRLRSIEIIDLEQRIATLEAKG
jgi:hypothetical protein